MSNLWRDLPVGPKPPKSVYAVVEVPRECTNKYEFDWKSGVFKLNRVLYSSLYYPGDYGIIPRTWYNDEDPLDILVLTTKPTFPGCVLEARPIGALLTEDEHGPDDKILAVPIRDPRWNEVKCLEDVGKHIRFEIADFFLNYKKLEPEKWVNVKEWKGCKAAEKIILSAMRMYAEEFGKER